MYDNVKEKIEIVFSHYGKTDYDNVRRQKIVHKIYRKVDGDTLSNQYVEVLDYENI